MSRYPREMKTHPPSSGYNDIHRVQHYSQTVEITPSTDEHIIYVISIQWSIYFSMKGVSTDTWYMNGSFRHYAMWKGKVSKEHSWYDSTYMSGSRDRQLIVREEEAGETTKRHGVCFWGDDTLELIRMHKVNHYPALRPPSGYLVF